MIKPNLLIFGDSFVSEYRDPSRETSELCKGMYTFYDKLAESGLFSSIKNLGSAGSNFWYSYQKFKKEYNPKTNFVLWAVTYPGRITNSRFGHVPSYLDAEYKLKNFKIEKEKHMVGMSDESYQEHLTFFTAARDYFLYLHDDEYSRWAQHLMIESILKNELTDNFLILPCYHQSLPSNIQPKNPLIEIFNFENKHLGIAEYSETLEKYTDIRCNHITEENHKILGKNILDHILQKKTILDINIKDFIKPTKDDIAKYLINK